MNTSAASKEHKDLRYTRLADLPEFLNVEEAASVLRVGKRVIYEMVKRGELTGVIHIGPKRITRIPAEAIRKLVK